MTALRSPFRRFVPWLGAVALGAFSAVAAHGATIVVSSTIDGFSPSDGCSLREALINANTDTKSGSVECAAGNGADTIILPPLTIQVQGTSDIEDDPRRGDIDVTSDITFWGGGAQFSLLEAYYGGRIFDVHPGATLTLRGLAMQRGYAEDVGGTIRVHGGATLLADDITIGSSKISETFAVAGKGAGIYGAPGSTVTVTRSQLAYNEALDALASGAALYCDDCTLDVSYTTFNDNKAGLSAAALYATAGSTVTLSFNTFGFNRAPTAAAMELLGDSTLLGVLSTDNGVGFAGDDVVCNASAFTAEYSFLEYPDAGCPLGTGTQTRSWVTGTTEANLLQEAILQRFDGQPSGILQWRISFFAVPQADCPVDFADQHRRTSAAVNDCDIGAYSRPVTGANPMVVQWSTNSAPVVMGVRVFRLPAVDTTLRINTIGGIGEVCSVTVPDVVIPAGSYTGTFAVDPDNLFPGPAIDRIWRVCEFEFEVIAGDPQLIGARSGIMRVKLHDTTLASAAGVSAPAPGKYLDFGTVPVSTGGDANVVFLPDVAGWDITGVTIGGNDASKFSTTLVPADFPIAVKTRGEGGTPIPFHCQGGAIGEYDANISITTSNPAYPTLIYGLRCRVAHKVSLLASESLVAERGGGSVDYTVQLDSPSVLAAPFTVTLVDAGGTATAGADYTLLPDNVTYNGNPAKGQVITFNPGESSHTVTVNVFDDGLIEDTESFAMLLDVPASNEYVLEGAGSANVIIDNDDFPVQDMTVTLTGVPERTPAGVRVFADVTLANTGTDPLTGLTVSINVDAPVRVISFGIGNASCSVADNRRSARCSFPHGVVRDGQVDTRNRNAIIGMSTVVYVPGWFPAGPGGAVDSLVFNDGTTTQSLAPAEYTLTVNADGSGVLTLAPTAFSGAGAFPASGSLTMSYSHPDSDIRVLQAVLEMAQMNDAPKLDIDGSVTVSAGASAGSQVLSASDKSDYVIIGQGIDLGALPYGSFLFLLLLALRGGGGKSRRSEGPAGPLL